ncbi:hypothetical protein BRN55_00015, partial [Xanthomonas oryzae pv. oryzae]
MLWQMTAAHAPVVTARGCPNDRNARSHATLSLGMAAACRGRSGRWRGAVPELARVAELSGRTVA